MAHGFLYNIETNEVWQNSKRHASKANDCVIIKSKVNLAERYGLRGLISIIPRLFGDDYEINPEWTANDILDLVWNKFGEITHEYNKNQRALNRAANPKVPRESRKRCPNTPRALRVRRPRTYRVCFEAIGEELRPASGRTVPHQKATILEGLRSQSSEILTEERLKEIVLKLHADGLLKTKQDPWRIWLYYENELHLHNLVIRKIEK